jgi:REP element-mobilizing transposase RayT
MPELEPDTESRNIFFVTTTAVQHAHVFRRDVVKRILVDCLYHLQAVDGAKLYGFAVMPNHVHFIVGCPAGVPLGVLMRDYKSNAARLIVRQIQADQDNRTLSFLASAVSRPEKQRYKVWEDGYIAKEVFTGEFLWQKLDYMHFNPLQQQWRLVEHPEQYVWSSARFYVLDEPALIPLADARRDWC